MYRIHALFEQKSFPGIFNKPSMHDSPVMILQQILMSVI